MPLFNPCDDFPSVVDGIEPVTLLRPGTPLAIELAALRGAVSQREAAASTGRYTAADVAWHLPGRTFTPEPRVGDLLVDGGGRRWTILSVTRATCGARWRCICRSLAVEQGLDDYIDLERAVATKSAAGAEVLAWRPWRTGLACRVQPVAGQLGAGGRQGARPLADLPARRGGARRRLPRPSPRRDSLSDSRQPASRAPGRINVSRC